MTGAGTVIVGASLAGGHAALTLRRLGYDAPVTLVGREHHLPYERPELSKGYLAGSLGREQLLVAAAGAYVDAGIDLRLGRTATGVDLDRRLLLTDDEPVPYDALVVATGSTNVRPPLPGLDLPGVFSLRTVDEADLLSEAAVAGARAVVMGMGLVGCEIAATLTGRGLHVTMVDPLPGPLWAALGPELSAVVAQWHVEHGVTLIGGAAVAALEGAHRVERVVLAGGRRVDADLVVIGVGARPATGWLDDVPIHLSQGGIGVDAHLRSSAENVFAAGDVAAVWDPLESRHRRVEHYSSAVDQGSRVAYAVMGAAVPEPEPSWFWTDQYGHHLQCAGGAPPEAMVIRRGDAQAWFSLESGVLRRAVVLDSPRDLRRALRLVGRVVDLDVLADPAADLRTALVAKA